MELWFRRGRRPSRVPRRTRAGEARILKGGAFSPRTGRKQLISHSTAAGSIRATLRRRVGRGKATNLLQGATFARHITTPSRSAFAATLNARAREAIFDHDLVAKICDSVPSCATLRRTVMLDRTALRAVAIATTVA